jgi:hypothetical protein
LAFEDPFQTDIGENGSTYIDYVNPSTNSITIYLAGQFGSQNVTLANGSTVTNAPLVGGGYLKLNLLNNLGLNYLELGNWSISTSPISGTNSDIAAGTTSVGFLVYGYQTPPASMPTTGSATYSGTGNVSGFTAIQGATTPAGISDIAGDGSLTANFATGAITGSFTNMTATPVSGGATIPWNSVALSGSVSTTVINGVSTGNIFSGTAAVTSAPANAASLAASAAGSFGGGFYGPTANEVGLSWYLQDAKGSFAVGIFGAPRVAPSDARLKTDIVAAGRSAGGADLYEYAYLSDPRRFVGVMAQDLMTDPWFADAVLIDNDGLMRVDYGRLGFIPPDFAAMAEAGERAVAIYRAAA